ncbi:MAG TPA: hypothetical protein DEA50_03535, partial [Parvularcula sp.]|nr:hypothetical protein [Parvularcula sp.]
MKSQYPDTLGEDTIIKEYNYEIENSDDIFRLSKEPVCPVWYADGIESNSYIHACHEVEGLFFGLDRYIMTDVFYIDLDDTYKSYSYEDRKSIIAGRILADGDVVERLSSQRKTRYLMDRTTNCREVIADQVSGLNSSFAISKKVVS